MKKQLLTLFFLSFLISAYSQSNMENVLATIVQNNKTILSHTQYWESQKLEFHTKLTPANPSVSYDYMIGSPATAGNQTDFLFTQEFDFPTAYIKRKQISEDQIKQVEHQLTVIRQEVLLEASKVCNELVYRNKLHLLISKRKNNSELLLKDFKTKLEKGDGNILDVHKIEIQLIEENKELQKNLSLVQELNTKLTELNGGNTIDFRDTVYAPLITPPPFEDLEKEIEAKDPFRSLLENDILISKKQVELSKAMSLPKFETGYHYQGILGQQFQGIHLGLTLPLWENSKMVKTQKARLIYTDMELQEHRIEHYYEIKKLHEKYSQLKQTLEQYQTSLKNFEYVKLLAKSLRLGHISTIEYFSEVNYYNKALFGYLETEKELYDTMAELYKYRL